MLVSADVALRVLCPLPTHAATGVVEENHDEEEGNAYETAGITLSAKVRFVERGLHQEPVAMLGLEKLWCELTEAELMVLNIQVLGLLYEIEKDEASWFYAFEHFTDDAYHLMDKGHYNRQGLVLCGSRPMLQVSVEEGGSLQGWFLLPLGKEKELEEQRVCLECLARWKKLQVCHVSHARGQEEQL